MISPSLSPLPTSQVDVYDFPWRTNYPPLTGDIPYDDNGHHHGDDDDDDDRALVIGLASGGAVLGAALMFYVGKMYYTTGRVALPSWPVGQGGRGDGWTELDDVQASQARLAPVASASAGTNYGTSSTAVSSSASI